jgi:hypothetical protein
VSTLAVVALVGCHGGDPPVQETGAAEATTSVEGTPVYRTSVALQGLEDGSPTQVPGPRHESREAAEREVAHITAQLDRGGRVRLPWLSVESEHVAVAALIEEVMTGEPVVYRTVVHLGERTDAQEGIGQIVGPPHQAIADAVSEMGQVHRAASAGSRLDLPWVAVPAERIDLAYVWVAPAAAS